MHYWTKLFINTKREASKQGSNSAYLLDRAGYASQASAGVFTLLPLGLRVVQKITQIVREEMDAIGSSELVMPSMQTKELWQKSGRWDDKDMKEILYVDSEQEVCFAPTHEELATDLVRPTVQSYRDLPVLIYQFQSKFRRELRPRSGLLRGREFMMKDLYSFHPDQESHNKFYEEVAQAYLNSFNRMGLEAYRIKASGGVFSKEYSDEFQVLSTNGEDEILVDHKSKTGFNKEVETSIAEDRRADLERVKSIEVGNIFHLGTKYSDSLALNYLDDKGVKHPVVMGSYGIGITRLLATLAEIYNDEHGLKLPLSVAPFHVHYINLAKQEDPEAVRALNESGLEVLADDRQVSAGEKFADADLVGCPIRLVYSDKTASESAVEIKYRETGKVELVSIKDLSDLFDKISP